jgi:superfamily I DNA/RNA helicase
VVAFAGSGKTTALRLLAGADSTPALYLAYNKSTQLAAQAHFPAHVACRTMHSLAYRAMRMFEQQHRLEHKLTGGELAQMLAIPTLDGLRPSFWGQCVIGTVRSFAHSTARTIDGRHLPPLPRGTDRFEVVLSLAQQLWARMRDPADEVPLEHDAYLKMWQLQGARLPAQAGVLHVDEAQDANPVTLAILEAQHRPTVWVGDPWQSI